MIRVLALHGYTQNGNIFGKKMGAIRKACAKDVEFVFVDAPIILHPADLPSSTAAYDSVPSTTTEPDPKLTPRAWWRANEAKTEYYGVEDSLRYLRGVLETQGRFNGVLGFSQGACMAALLCAYLENPSAQPIFDPPPHASFDFCILISGFAPMAPTLPAKIRTPTLHVLGRTDTLVSNKRSQTLVDESINPRVELHEGGHFVPSKASWRHFFHTYIVAFDPASAMRPEDVRSPMPTLLGDESAPASGAMTPMDGVMTPRGLL